MSFRKSILIIYLSEERAVHTKFRHSAKEVEIKMFIRSFLCRRMGWGMRMSGCSLLADRVNKVDNLQGGTAGKSPRKKSSLKLVQVFVYA